MEKSDPHSWSEMIGMVEVTKKNDEWNNHKTQITSLAIQK